MDRPPEHPTDSIFGNGQDGPLVIGKGETVTLDRDMHYTTVILKAYGTLDVNGCRVFCKQWSRHPLAVIRNGATVIG
jgi:hypothetical protein